MTEKPLAMAGLPGTLTSSVDGVWAITGSQLRGNAAPGTDLFLDPIGDVRKLDAAMLLFEPDPEFTLSACVDVTFQGTFDAGVLVLYQDESNWAKLCFEYSPQGQPMVVSVVTHGVSDDCNSVAISGHRVYLRVARIGRGFAFHYSMDGQQPWQLVRAFGLADLAVRAGFLVQSPMGQGCQVDFSSLAYAAAPLSDLRNGQ
ncbi:DUF1349 domain-containing protein [uncultured Paludibaculum sp.]|uniref:DUF1349 domain-containing protein n=1 Tax=uncultured Paludibaculum sp. TaxID=1765020 RepID=UPI002AAACB60|nr:DUF1349 domain-containing protein [uncultured Paludibaculum sp.]